MTRIGDIYGFINELAPFELQEGYDNSGLCIGSMWGEVSRVLVALDCTVDVAEEAAKKGAGLIVTHHPVIFRPIKSLDLDSLVGRLARDRISVLSAHTNFDAAKLNLILCDALGLTPTGEDIADGIGCICETEPIEPKKLAEDIKKRLGCQVVRYNDCGLPITSAAVCSGSGGSFLKDVIAKGCSGFITGDVKHDVFVDAYNAGVTVFDAGHFHTEDIFCRWMRDALAGRFPELTVEVAATDRDLLSYC